MNGEKFKEICLNSFLKDDSNNDLSISNQLNDFLKYVFDPEKELNLQQVNDVKQICEYLSGGLSYEDYKQKGK